MSFLRFIFVLLLCIPLGYAALRLIIALIDQVTDDVRKKRKVRR